MRTFGAALLVAIMIAGLFGCSGERIRREDEKSQTALQLDFDATDRREISDHAIQSMLLDPVITGAAKPPVILVGEKFVKNLTEKHITHKALVDMMVNAMVASRKMSVIDMDSRADLHEEYQYHAAGYIDPTMVKGPGKELGADYILAGRITEDVQKKDGNEVIVFMTTLQLIDLSTKQIKWSDVKEIKKSKTKTGLFKIL